MLQLIFLAVFTLAIIITTYLMIPKNTDMPGEAIFNESAREIIKEKLMRPIDWISYQVNTKDKRCLEILDENPTRFAIKRVASMTFFGVLGYLVSGPLTLVVGMFLGWFVPAIFLRSRYETWQKNVAAEIPTMVDYLIVYFSVGYNTKKALAEVAEVVGPELSDELKRLNADIEITKNYRGALEALSDRVNDYNVDMVLQRLKSSWETKADPDLFEDLSNAIVEMRKLKVSIATAKAKIFMVILPVLGLGGIFIMVGVPLIYWVMGQFSGISIGK